MKFFNLCIVTYSLLGISIATNFIVESQANDFQIKKFAKPAFQRLNLTLDPDNDTFSGSTSIELTVLEPTRIIEISGRDYQPHRVQLMGEKSCVLSATALATHKLRLACEHEITPGQYTLNIDFSAPYNKRSVGLYKTIDNNSPYLFTQFEMSDARRAFPVFDEPAYKIPFQLTITAPSDQKVYTNTPVIKRLVKGDMTTHYFDKTPPIPSYLVAMAVGPFVETRIKGMPIDSHIITTPTKQPLTEFSAREMPAILSMLEDYFGRPYPYKKLDSVAVPEFPFGAMENAGLITYREDILLIDDDNASQRTQQRSVSVIAHELAHQWYGNLVTMTWWNDLWLNEAFASWMAAKVTHALHPEFGSDLDLPQNRVMAMDARLSTKPVRKPIKTEDDIMDGLSLAYSKGSAVLSMVENWIGEADFQKGIQAYMTTFAFSNAKASDLWNALAKASGKDVPAVLQSFIEQSSFPLITVIQTGKTLVLSQKRFANQGVDAPAQMWHVPVSIKYGHGNKVGEKRILLSSASATVKLDFEPEWVYPDAHAMGYYRWVADDKAFEHLLVQADAVLSAREKRALIANSQALMKAGLMPAGQLLKLLGLLMNDNHPRVVSTALSLIEAQKPVFIDDINAAAWARFMTARAADTLKRYGLSRHPGEAANISTLRPQLLSLLAFEGKDKRIIDLAEKEANAYIRGDTDVDPYTIPVYLKVAAFYGDDKLLNRYIEVFETTQAPKVRTNLLMALSYFNNKALQLKTLDYLLSHNITASDMRYAMDGHSFKKARRARFRQWVYSHYDALSKKLPPFSLPQLPNHTGAGCDAKALNDTQRFFTAKAAEVPAFTRTLEKLAEHVTDCIRLKQREQASVNQYLQTFASE